MKPKLSYGCRKTPPGGKTEASSVGKTHSKDRVEAHTPNSDNQGDVCAAVLDTLSEDYLCYIETLVKTVDKGSKHQSKEKRAVSTEKPSKREKNNQPFVKPEENRPLGKIVNNSSQYNHEEPRSGQKNKTIFNLMADHSRHSTAIMYPTPITNTSRMKEHRSKSLNDRESQSQSLTARNLKPPMTWTQEQIEPNIDQENDASIKNQLDKKNADRHLTGGLTGLDHESSLPSSEPNIIKGLRKESLEGVTIPKEQFLTDINDYIHTLQNTIEMSLHHQGRRSRLRDQNQLKFDSQFGRQSSQNHSEKRGATSTRHKSRASPLPCNRHQESRSGSRVGIRLGSRESQHGDDDNEEGQFVQDSKFTDQEDLVRRSIDRNKPKKEKEYGSRSKKDHAHHSKERQARQFLNERYTLDMFEFPSQIRYEGSAAIGTSLKIGTSPPINIRYRQEHQLLSLKEENSRLQQLLSNYQTETKNLQRSLESHFEQNLTLFRSCKRRQKSDEKKINLLAKSLGQAVEKIKSQKGQISVLRELLQGVRRKVKNLDWKDTFEQDSEFQEDMGERLLQMIASKRTAW